MMKHLKAQPNGKPAIEVDFTPQEVAHETAQRATRLAGKPLRDWKNDMAATDGDMSPRVLEEILDFIINGTSIPVDTVAKLDNRKAKRAEKPA